MTDDVLSGGVPPGWPAGDLSVPELVRELAGAARVYPVWHNGEGGTTWRTSDGRHIKHARRGAETSLAAEADRMRWAASYTPVPRVIEVGTNDTAEWLITASVSADSAVAARWRSDRVHAERAVRAVATALRALHDALPVADCPFRWDVPARILAAEGRGATVPEHLRQPPTVDRLVVCHGDACCPNTLLDRCGNWVAHVDMGALGVADRWADIAVSIMSTEWNYGPGWGAAFLDSYGVEPDPVRQAYYQELWEAG